MTNERPTASDILLEAEKIVTGSRQQTHGEKERSFADAAALWSAYKGVDFSPRDVAEMMILLKIARAKSGTPIPDHFIDMAGYAGLAGEMA